MPRISLVLVWFICLHFSGMAQETRTQTPEELLAVYKERADTLEGKELIEFLYEVSDAYWNFLPNLDSQQYYIELAQDLSKTENYPGLFAYGQMLYGDFEKLKGNYKLAAALYEDGKKRYIEQEDSVGLAIMLNSEASLYSALGQQKEAMETTLAAARLFHAQNSLRGAATCYLNLGTHQNRLHNFQKAVDYYQLAYEMRFSLTRKGRAVLYNAMSINVQELYERNQDSSLLDQSARYLQEGEALVDSLGQPKLIAANMIQQIALSKLRGGYSIDLLPQVDSALSFARKSRSDFMLSEVHYTKADLLAESGAMLDSAMIYADSAVYYAEKKEKEDILTRGAYKVRYQIAKQKGDYKLALADLERYTTIKDTIIYNENLEKLNKLEAEFELEQKEAELLLLRQEEELNAIRIKRWRWLTLSVILVGLLTVGLVYTNFRRRQLKAKNRTMEVEQQLFRAQMNPHFLFNSLNSIKRIYNEGRLEEANDLLVDFSTLIREILNRSSVTYVSIEEEVEFLKLYLDIERRRLQKKLDFRVHIDADLVDQELSIPSLLLQPLVENSIWHGITQSHDDGIIELEIKGGEDSITCYVRDNGIGYETARKRKQKFHQSRGMHLIRQRIGKQGELIIHDLSSKVKAATEAVATSTISSLESSQFSQGTEVILKIPTT